MWQETCGTPVVAAAATSINFRGEGSWRDSFSQTEIYRTRMLASTP